MFVQVQQKQKKKKVILAFIFVYLKKIETEARNAPAASKKDQEYPINGEIANKTQFKVDPSIFVSLKKGSINSSYKIGEVLGEGNFNLK